MSEIIFNDKLFKYELKNLIKDDAKYNLWIAPLILELKNNTLTITVENTLFKNKINELYKTYFYSAAKLLNYKIEKIEFHIAANENNQNAIYKNRIYSNNFSAQRELFYTNQISIKLNPKFEFDNFIIDDSNKVAYKNAIIVAKNLGQLFNPFILYGEEGAGKSHLAQSIAKHILSVQPQINLKYFDANFFKDLYLNALRRNSQLEFRERFRNADIFIIENIEELEGCFSVQEELFHIYNNLIQKNNQLIITSSINPLKLVDFMPRLINRFSTGLSLEIQKPSNNLKIKFIKNKLEDCELFLHDDLINYFLEQCGNASLKKIDVALNKLIAYLSVTKKNINKITIDEVFSKISNIPQAITINDIQTSVSQYFNIQIDLMKTKIRKQDILLPKYIAIYLTRELTNFSLQKISNDFGKIDKSTINHACKKIKNLIATNDDKVCRVVKDLTNLICSKS